MRVKNKKEKNEFREAINKHLKRNLRSINMRLHDLSVCNPDWSYDD